MQLLLGMPISCQQPPGWRQAQLRKFYRPVVRKEESGAMTRFFLVLLAFVETVLGALALFSAATLYFAHAADLTLPFLPLLALAALFLMAGATIFVRRPWSYYTHIAVILLAGLLLWLNLGSLVGSDLTLTLLLGGLIAALTALFFLPPVRRYFGV